MNTQVNGSSVAQREQEWELQEASHYSQFNQEGEEEQSESFLRRLQGIEKVARATAPVAKSLAPLAVKTLVGAIPTQIGRNLLSSLLQEGERSAVAMEAQYFGTNEAEAQVSKTEVAHEAALAEVLAAEASHSGSESEAVAFLSAAVPGIVKSLGGRGVLRPIMPTLILANARLVRLLHQKGLPGRRLLRLVPTILRRTSASLRAAHQAGQPITSDLALRLIADQASRVLGNSQVVTSGIIRNAVIQKRTTR